MFLQMICFHLRACHMSVKPAEYLASADTIQKSALTEGCYRSAISRSYYAAYHRAIEALPAPEYTGGGMHKSYISSLQKQAPSTLARRLGITLKYIYQLRVISDYHPQHDISEMESKMVIASANKVFDILK